MNDTIGLARSVRPSTRRQMLFRATVGLAACGSGSLPALTSFQDGLSHAAESIHQEPVFKTSPKRVYEALTDAKQFDNVSQLSAAVQSGIDLGSKPTQIDAQPGGLFTLFRGHIVGRQIELVPNERIVQAWRVVTWSPGLYSIVRFELTSQGSTTKLVFNHIGFPDGQGQHLAEGWKINYWEPLEKFLA